MFDRQSEKLAVRLWMLAAVSSAAAHLGFFAIALEYMRDDDFALGAPAVEIEIELLSPHLEPIAVTPGPSVDASLFSRTQQNALEVTHFVPTVPTATDDQERIAVPLETSEKLQSVARADPATISAESVPAEATAPPVSDVIPVSTRSVTPAQGTGESPERVRATWQKDLIAHFNRHKRYPAEGSSQGAQILVAFSIDETGRVLSSSIMRGSGKAAFDAAALAMIERSNPVPRPPSLVAQDGLDFTLPVIFRPARNK